MIVPVSIIFIAFNILNTAGISPYRIEMKQEPAPDKHRCGVCPTYFQKICGFEAESNSTFIFDNHCIMDLYNCIEGANFKTLNYEKCVYFGNFAYVHGYKYDEGADYEDDHIMVKGAKKNPNFIDLE